MAEDMARKEAELARIRARLDEDVERLASLGREACSLSDDISKLTLQVTKDLEARGDRLAAVALLTQVVATQLAVAQASVSAMRSLRASLIRS